MRMITAVLLVGLTAASTPALAQGAGPVSENGRFSFKETADGLLRLDGRTGQVSLCAKRSAGWACQTVPDDRAALENEIARLQDENAVLRKSLAGRAQPPSGPTGEPGPTKRGDRDLALPSDAEVDRMMSFLERIWRRLFDMAQRTQREFDQRNFHRQRLPDNRI